MDADQFLVACRLIGEGNSEKVASERVASNTKDFRRHAFRNFRNYKMYCASLFLYNKTIQQGDSFRPLVFKKRGYNSFSLNMQERSALETYLRRKGLT